ncbi:DUF4013 domain-containing protein [Methanoregula sp.]|uniref:DUF4013 domain-containing protein n=1 Tax=Methanoregula sp. TaxID=2052170 RepID=UPI0025E22D27|nr:DUF4013 domain-containing protein [Methanoregula sp.]
MDNGILVTESFSYAKETLIGKWTRWLIFIICGLPMALLPFIFDPEKIAKATEFSWDLIPWKEMAVLFIAAFLLSFILSGYLARIYRGAATPPEFDNWGPLYIDGIKIFVTGLLWFIPVALAFLLMIAFAILGLSQDSHQPGPLGISLVVIFVIITVALAIIALLYSMMGIIRCARTGSIREGIRFTAITGILRSIGWVNYLIALVVLFVIGIVFFFALSAISLIPYVGDIIQLVFIPVYTIFSARYMTRVYEHSEPQGAGPVLTG